MAHHKKPRLNGSASDYALNRNSSATANELSGDVVAIIFGCFPPKDIMRMRCVCKKWREAAKGTIVPIAEFRMNSVNKYNALVAMTTALPNLQEITLRDMIFGHRFVDGEDPYEARVTLTANFDIHDIDIISNFRKLRVLHIETVYLNGRYPVLFDFPLLRELRVTTSDYLKFDLGILSAGCPSLKTLKVTFTENLTGDLRSLRVLKDTLEKVEITSCQRIEGNFMDLAAFPRLKKLDLWGTATTGDIRDICKKYFPALENLCLPDTVIGGSCYKFHSISEVPSFMHTIHVLLQRTPDLFDTDITTTDSLLSTAFCWELSKDSPDWYQWESGCAEPPFNLKFIRAGSRLGWSWCTWNGDYSCEINWLDPEPSSENIGYEDYIEELQLVERCADFY